jgi:hypothetical protein
MGLKRGRVLVESIRDLLGEDSRFGIANVHPNRAVKKCRIRNLRIEYYMTDSAIVLIEPDVCSTCEVQSFCADEFAQQIILKQNAHR